METCFRIAAHVHVCVTGDGSVVLDLARDKYLGLGPLESELLAGAVSGWPTPSWTPVLDGAGTCEEDARRLCESLAADGLLASGGGATTMPASEQVRIDMQADWDSVGDELEVRSRLRAQHVLQFIWAYLSAWYSIRRRPLLETVETVRAKKRSGLGAVCAVHPGDPDDIFRVAAMVDVFRRLRPWVFAPEGRCLVHALTLINFSRGWQVYPDWVIGVSTQPWGAHSWVQWGKFLIDTNPEKVCQFTPILVV
jgi:hypothetical protein